MESGARGWKKGEVDSSMEAGTCDLLLFTSPSSAALPALSQGGKEAGLRIGGNLNSSRSSTQLTLDRRERLELEKERPNVSQSLAFPLVTVKIKCIPS